MKHPLIHIGTAVALLGALAACETSAVVTPTGTMSVQLARLQQAAPSSVHGSVKVPLGYSGDRRLAALIEQPLVGAPVLLADLAGEPLPDFAATVTDAAGQYRFQAVPAGQTLLVIARIKTPVGESAELRTLVRTLESGVQADLSLPATLLTAGLLQAPVAEAPWTQEAFAATAARVGELLHLDRVPDMADPDAVLAEINGLAAAHCDLKLALMELQAGSDPTAACTPSPSPTPRPRFGGGGSSGGAAAPPPSPTPAPGAMAADITISDGPRILATPTPMP